MLWTLCCLTFVKKEIERDRITFSRNSPYNIKTRSVCTHSRTLNNPPMAIDAWCFQYVNARHAPLFALYEAYPSRALQLVHGEHLARLHVVLKLLDHVGDIIGGDQIIYDGAYNLKLEDAKPRRKEEKRKERARG
jgi:hypothetical protein